MTPQQAVEAPRVASYSFPNSFSPHSEPDRLLRVESRIGEDVRRDLAARGHDVEVWPEQAFDAGSVCMALDLRRPPVGMRGCSARRRIRGAAPTPSGGRSRIVPAPACGLSGRVVAAAGPREERSRVSPAAVLRGVGRVPLDVGQAAASRRSRRRPRRCRRSSPRRPRERVGDAVREPRHGGGARDVREHRPFRVDDDRVRGDRAAARVGRRLPGDRRRGVARGSRSRSWVRRAAQGTSAKPPR